MAHFTPDAKLSEDDIRKLQVCVMFDLLAFCEMLYFDLKTKTGGVFSAFVKSVL